MEKKSKSFSHRRFYLLIEFWNFMKVNKKWWLLPIILMLLFVSVLIILSSTAAVSPFIYVLI